MADATERQGAQLALREPLRGPQLHDPVDGRSAPPATSAAQLPCEAAEDPQQEARLHGKPEQRLASAHAVPQEVRQPDDHGEIVPGGSVCGSGRPDASSPGLASCEGCNKEVGALDPRGLRNTRVPRVHAGPDLSCHVAVPGRGGKQLQEVSAAGAGALPTVEGAYLPNQIGAQKRVTFASEADALPDPRELRAADCSAVACSADVPAGSPVLAPGEILQQADKAHVPRVRAGADLPCHGAVPDRGGKQLQEVAAAEAGALPSVAGADLPKPVADSPRPRAGDRRQVCPNGHALGPLKKLESDEAGFFGQCSMCDSDVEVGSLCRRCDSCPPYLVRCWKCCSELASA